MILSNEMKAYFYAFDHATFDFSLFEKAKWGEEYFEDEKGQAKHLGYIAHAEYEPKRVDAAIKSNGTITLNAWAFGTEISANVALYDFVRVNYETGVVAYALNEKTYYWARLYLFSGYGPTAKAKGRWNYYGKHGNMFLLDLVSDDRLHAFYKILNNSEYGKIKAPKDEGGYWTGRIATITTSENLLLSDIDDASVHLSQGKNNFSYSSCLLWRSKSHQKDGTIKMILNDSFVRYLQELRERFRRGQYTFAEFVGDLANENQTRSK
jgi:hypothetical protein